MMFRFVLARIDNTWTLRPFKVEEMSAPTKKPIQEYFKEASARPKKSKNSAANDDPDQPAKSPRSQEEKVKQTVEAKSPVTVNDLQKHREKKTAKKGRRKKVVEGAVQTTMERKPPKKPIVVEIRDEEKQLKQSSMKSHFQVRRSGRRPKSAIKNEKHDIFLQKILDEDESGLEVKVLPDKGRGVFAAKDFAKGDLICEYAGELIDYSLGLEREKQYAENPEFGCYSYFFQYKNKKYCVDATKESDRLGRLLNHSRTDNNVCTRVFPIKDIPRLILVANRNITTGEELVYDYGERDKHAIESHPWLRT